ncbi:IS66 family transposase [Enterococcus faecium]|uniref:IS66 family transposase n=1 Tax=Enterococcus faecium TaxID=1352 RepID=UPI0039C6993A
MESVRLVYCFAHVRRKFSEAIQKEERKKTRIFPQLKQSNNWINGLVLKKKKWKDFSQKRLSCRQQELRHYLCFFYEWMATIDPVAKSRTGYSRSICV